MCDINAIDSFLSKLAPKNLSEDWDNDGIMLCKRRNLPVKKVLVALEVRRDVAEFAAKEGYDLIITHHPFIFKKLSRISDSCYDNFEILIKNGISVLSYHTRLDSTGGGVNDVLAERLCLCETFGFGGENCNAGRIGNLKEEMTGEEFAYYLKEMLGCDMRCFIESGRIIKKVAVVGGAGKDFIPEACAYNIDAFVTSEIPHHLFIEAQAYGFNLYDCGHYYTENPVCTELCDLLQKEFPEIEATYYDVKCPYTCIH